MRDTSKIHHMGSWEAIFPTTTDDVYSFSVLSDWRSENVTAFVYWGLSLDTQGLEGLDTKRIEVAID